MTSKQAARTVSEEWIGTDEVDRILAETYFSNSRGDNERRKLSKRKSSDQLGQYVALKQSDRQRTAKANGSKLSFSRWL